MSPQANVRARGGDGQTHLEVERVELGSEEYGEEEHYREVVCEVGSTFPLECCPVCGRELAEDAPSLLSDA